MNSTSDQILGFHKTGIFSIEKIRMSILYNIFNPNNHHNQYNHYMHPSKQYSHRNQYCIINLPNHTFISKYDSKSSGNTWWMVFRGARNVRASVGSMNPFQTMGKADFTLIDPRYFPLLILSRHGQGSFRSFCPQVLASPYPFQIVG